jgi:hypothetical protein
MGVILATAFALAGCASGVGGLAPPAPRLMTSPEPLPKNVPGEDLIQAHAELKRDYSQCSGRLKGLQRYVRTATDQSK